MRSAPQFILLGVLSLFILGIAAAQKRPTTDPVAQFTSNVQRLAEKQKRFVDYGRQFDEFARANSDLQYAYEAAVDLQRVANATEERLAATITLLQIYADLACSEDRAKASPRIGPALARYRADLDDSIKRTNADITHTQQLGVISKADRMRDDLKETAKILDSIKLP
jgi:hypothetical protein